MYLVVEMQKERYFYSVDGAVSSCLHRAYFFTVYTVKNLGQHCAGLVSQCSYVSNMFIPGHKLYDSEHKQCTNNKHKHYGEVISIHGTLMLPHDDIS